MTYIDYMNQFWRFASVHPIPASEVAVYAFLVNECNARYWKIQYHALHIIYVSRCICRSRLS